MQPYLKFNITEGRATAEYPPPPPPPPPSPYLQSVVPANECPFSLLKYIW